MHLLPLRLRHAILVTLVLFTPLEFKGTGNTHPAPQPPHDPCACEDIDITVDHTKPKGVHRKAVYLCTGNSITWVLGPHVKSFEVEFDDPSPFGDLKTFDNSNPKTPAMPDPGEFTVFKYKIT